ncbi:MAG: P-loop NTPase [Collinsella intestinalis]
MADHGGPRAPVIAVVSGQGGAGKTTLVAAMAACAARAGLRAAVMNVDLMFGDLPSVLGVDAFRASRASKRTLWTASSLGRTSNHARCAWGRGSPCGTTYRTGTCGAVRGTGRAAHHRPTQGRRRIHRHFDALGRCCRGRGCSL